MGVILDSSITIRAERQRIPETELLQQIRAATGEQLMALSAIGVTELVHGIYRADTSARSAYRRLYVEDLLQDLPVVDYTTEVARLAGRIDGEQRAIGNAIPYMDLLIGATALSIGFSILTYNIRHFRKIPNLNVIPF